MICKILFPRKGKLYSDICPPNKKTTRLGGLILFITACVFAGTAQCHQ